MNNISGIYQIRCLVNNEIYIGSAFDLKRRHKEHINDLKRNDHHSHYLNRCYNKYGHEICLEFSVLEHCSVEELIDRENHYLWMLKPKFNTNLCANSSLGVKRTEEQRTRMSLSRIGSKHSDNTKKKMSKSAGIHLRKPVLQIHLDTGEVIAEYESISEAARVMGVKSGNISEVCIGKMKLTKSGKKYLCNSCAGFTWRYKNEGFSMIPFIGKLPRFKPTEETKEKLRNNRLGKKASKETRKRMSLSAKKQMEI